MQMWNQPQRQPELMPAMAPGWWVAGLLGAVLGVALQLQLASLPGLAWHVALGLGAVLLWCGAWLARRAGRFGWAQVGVLLAVAALSWTCTGVRAHLVLAQALSPALEGRELRVTGVVASLPREDATGSSFALSVDAAFDRGVAVPLPQTLRLSWRSSGNGMAPLRVRPGERWEFTVRLQRPHGLSNPGGFDAELWLWEQGVGATGTVRVGTGARASQRLASTWRYPVQQARYHMRERLLQSVQRERPAGVMVALLAGDQAAIAAADWAVFRDTGVAHLVSVSGVHITMFAWLAMWVLRGLWSTVGRYRPALLWAVPTPVAAQVGGVALAAAYAVFSGWAVPSQRTVLMLATVVALRLSGRHWPWPVVWLAAMNSVIWVDPWALMQPGFWLSFVAVAVLFATAGSALPGGTSGRWWQAARDMLRTQAIVTVALAPLTLLLFGQFSVVSLLANLVAIPWVTLLVTPLTMLGAVVPGLWWLTAYAVDVWLWLLHIMAQWPWAVVQRPALPGALAVLAVVGGVVLVMPWPWVWRGWGLLLVWPALVFEPPRPPPGEFELLVVDVGQGGAALIRTAQHTLLYDTGPPWGRQSTTAERVLLPLLRHLGEQPHTVVVSHSDSDHASGASVLAQAFPQARWISSGPLPVGQVVQGCVAGQSWVWDQVVFEVLHPRHQDYGTGLSDNAMSCVLRVGGPQGVLLTGDITREEETRLALEQPDLRAAVLLLAHHGSKTSSGVVWLNTVRPQWGIVQSGYRNRYGHPAPEVLRRLDERHIPWVNTATCGALAWRSAQPDALACHREQVRRYWHHPGVGAASSSASRTGTSAASIR